jgi:hypothetical protein
MLITALQLCSGTGHDLHGRRSRDFTGSAASYAFSICRAGPRCVLTDAVGPEGTPTLPPRLRQRLGAR